MVYIPPTAHGVSAGFTTDVQRQCITNNNFNFYNTSLYLGVGSWINKYYWFFGDGTTDFSNTSVFNKQYAAPGTYTVMLVAEALNGCRDTMTMNVVVEAIPCAGVVFANNNSPYTGINFVANPALSFETPVATGVKETSVLQKGFILYPNPTAGNFTIRCNKALSGNLTVKVYDMFGKTLYFQSEKQMDLENMQINGEGLADGKYFVVLYQNDEFVGKESIVIIH
jgi:PKD repeat protein